MPESNLDKLKGVLAELFMLDQADLDFGIYRVMNAKRAEVTRFLDQDLLPQVRAALAQHSGLVTLAKQAELDQAVENARRLGVNPDTVPKVQELREGIQRDANPEALENEVFSDLANFFRRYYRGGDFLSLRRYKAGVYAIPYEGEEVKLHWANADQYYIKTSEYLRDYTFKLADGKRVHFKLAEADTEADNKKAAAGQERRFILCATEPLVEADGELIIRFEYRPDADKRKQADLNTLAAQAVFAAPGFTAWKAALATPASTEKNPKRTLLDKHLADYTARNTFDYFIHKDIGGFLRRELDFFIKNEIMHLDDIEAEQAPRVEQYLAKIKAIRLIARKIIAFLEQLENFQKKLWLKKKFVVETQWCITLDRVPEALYPEIAANEAQRAEWVRLFAIDEIQGDLARAGYTTPLSSDFLKANPYLVLDTQFFSTAFKEKLLADNRILGGAISLDQATEGLLIRSENFQAMYLLQARHREAISFVFADPPYNTGSDDFIYKDQYRHSTWASMIADRLRLARTLLRMDGALWCTLDGSETPRFWLLAEELFGIDGQVAHAVWQHSIQTKGYAGKMALGHNNVFCLPKSAAFAIGTLERTEQHNQSYANPDNDPKGAWRTGYLVNSLYRPNLIYEVKTPSGKSIPAPSNGWRYSKETMQAKIASGEIFFSADETRLIRKIYLEDQEGHVPNSVWLGKDCGTSRSANLELKQILPDNEFATAKPLELLCRIFDLSTSPDGIALDAFGGSGATGHAVIGMNRGDGGKRKYVLIEMGDHFDTVLKPRLQRVIYSKNWKDGKPISREGSSHLFKYIRLESYEDALNNLELKRTPEQDDLLRQHAELREDYLLRYQLDVETRDSASLLNVAAFTNPFAYQLKVATGSVGESRPVTVDLVETFNYLLGLRVAHLDTIRGFRVVQGLNPAGEKVLVLWRNVAEKSNADLDTFFQKQGYNTKDMEFALIYVNGDNNLENLKRTDDTWKVRRTEDEFKRLMFDVADV